MGNDRIAAWFLFWLCFAAACCVAFAITKELSKKTESIVDRTSSFSSELLTATDSGIGSLDYASMDLWFESLNLEQNAVGSMKAWKTDTAFQELESAIQKVERIQKDNPEFRRKHIEYRLEELREKRKFWQREVSEDRNPFPSKELKAVDDAIKEELTISPADLVKSDTSTVGDPVIDVPTIGSGNLEATSSPGFIKWEGGDENQDLLSDTLISPANSITGSLLSPMDSPMLSKSAATVRSGFQRDAVTAEVTSPKLEPEVKPDIEVMTSDPSSIWYRAFSATRKAKDLEAEGNIEAAREKYHEAKTCYDILNREFPEFESEHIRNGSEILAAKLNKMVDQ